MKTGKEGTYSSLSGSDKKIVRRKLKAKYGFIKGTQYWMTDQFEIKRDSSTGGILEVKKLGE